MFPSPISKLLLFVQNEKWEVVSNGTIGFEVKHTRQ